MVVTEEEIAKAHAEFETKFKPAEAKRTADELATVVSTTQKIRVDGFEFEVSTFLTPKQMRIIANEEKIDVEHFDYNKFIEPFAELMGEICVDKSLDKVFWLNYDKETGYLPDVVEYVMAHSERAKPKIESFR